jgi:DNA-binding GntR family transcriptional regulator
MPGSASANSPPTTTAFVLDSIRDGILNGQYALGSRFDQKEIAEDLGVSLVPVREALRMLEGEGFVTINPRRGAFVTDISIAELEELYLIRAELEELATWRAVPNLDPARVTELATIIERMAEATNARDYAQLMELNRVFHFTIYEAADLVLLLEMMGSLWNRSSLYRRVFTYLPERAIQALQEHKEIYGACRAGNAEAAAKAVRRNIRQTVIALLDEFQNNEEVAFKPLAYNGQPSSPVKPG